MKIGAQLYTVHDFTKTLEEFADTLAKVADIGYTSVQVSGTCDYEPQWLAEQLKKNGLTCDLTHFDYDRIVNETDKVVAEHKLFGCKYIGIGGMPDLWKLGMPAYAPFRDTIQLVARRIRELGCKFMYHNHDIEFKTRDEMSVMEHMAQDFPPSDFGFTLDTYWVMAGGSDPVEWLKKLDGQLQCIHFKDMIIETDGTQKFAPIGEGILDFDAIIETAMASGTEYAFIEQDNCYGEDPFECLKRSYQYLASKGLS